LPPVEPATPTRFRGLLAFFKLVVFVLVLWGVWRSLTSIRDDLNTQQLDPRSFHWGWFGLASVWYALAQVPVAAFWRRILLAFGQDVSPWCAFRAFCLGHPGKYVPTKMLVVAIRASLVAGMTAALPLAVASVFVETFTTMAAGAGLATLALTCFTADARVWGVALASLAFCLLGSLPISLRSIARLALGRRWNQPVANAMSQLDTRLILCGWGYATFSWLAMSVSVICTLRILPGTPDVAWSIPAFARILAATCLAVVAGFVSLIPGGLVAREWVLGILLAPLLGNTAAVLVPLLLRINWLLTEIGGSAILLLVRAGHHPASTQGTSIR
jgi:uncharacterized membrane protein YbhN (UPF0104 family)